MSSGSTSLPIRIKKVQKKIHCIRRCLYVYVFAETAVGSRQPVKHLFGLNSVVQEEMQPQQSGLDNGPGYELAD